MTVDLIETNLTDFLEQVNNGDIKVSYLGEGADRIAFRIEKGEHAGMVLKMEKDEDSEYGFIEDNICENYSSGRFGVQTEAEIDGLLTIKENSTPEEWEYIKKLFLVPVYYDLNHNCQITNLATTSVYDYDCSSGFSEYEIQEGEFEEMSELFLESSLEEMADDEDIFYEIFSQVGPDRMGDMLEASRIYDDITGGARIPDIHEYNIGYHEGYAKIIDLGLFGH